MANAYIGEIRMFAGNFNPKNFQLCNGQLLPIQQYAALFSIIGTYYGGNGTSNFQLPNLQGRAPMHWGNGAGLTPRVLGESAGTEKTTLLQNNLPIHNHTVNCVDGNAGAPSPQGALFAKQGSYSTSAANGTMNAAMLGQTGGNVPVSILQPYLAVSFIICISGLFPSRN